MRLGVRTKAWHQGDASPPDIAGILWDFRLEQDDMHLGTVGKKCQYRFPWKTSTFVEANLVLIWKERTSNADDVLEDSSPYSRKPIWATFTYANPSNVPRLPFTLYRQRQIRWKKGAMPQMQEGNYDPDQG